MNVNSAGSEQNYSPIPRRHIMSLLQNTSTTTTTTTSTTRQLLNLNQDNNNNNNLKGTMITIIDPENPDTEIDPIIQDSSSSSSSTSSPSPGTTTTVTPEVIHLVLTEATLLSGNLDECIDADDETCVGGVAAVSAMVRHFTASSPQQQQQHHTLVFPKFEKQSQFVQVHPLSWSVNRLVLQGLLGWKVLMSTPSLLLQNARDGYGSTIDLTFLQRESFPLLITNVQLPPSNSWSMGYHEFIHFSPETGMALMSMANSGEPMNYDQVQSAWGALYKIADANRFVATCGTDSDSSDSSDRMEIDIDIDSTGEIAAAASTPKQQQQQQQQQPVTNCWIPVVVFDDGGQGNFQYFIQQIMKHPYPPALIIDVDKQAVQDYPYPMLVHIDVSGGGDNNRTTTTNITTITHTNSSKAVWIHSFDRDENVYYQHDLHLHYTSTGIPIIHNVTLMEQDIEVLPEEYKDDLYRSHIDFLRKQALLAIQNDPQVGYSTEFPIARIDEYRRCQGGECEIGNLFCDAMRWKANSDIAFTASGGLRGEGWPAGPVHTSNIWSSWPFPNSLCTGVMSGISLFKMMDYSISIATFEGEDTNDGERLLQIAGMQIVYNTLIPHGTSRILSIHVWNHPQQEWLPIERLTLYTFATDSYTCSAYDPYPEYLGAFGNFTLEGEVPGRIQNNGALIQTIAAEYLQQLEGPYDAAIQGRLVNNTLDFDVLNLVQTQETCAANSYWSERRGTCFPCPDSTHVGFSDERLEFEGQLSNRQGGGIIPTEESQSSSIVNATAEAIIHNATVTDPSLFENVLRGRILLTNRELTNFSVVPKAIPGWVTFVDMEQGRASDRYVLGGPSTLLLSGSMLALDFVVGDDNLTAGTAIGTVSFGILGLAVVGDEGIRACDDYTRDATFDIFLRITPPLELNELGNSRYIGIAIMCVALATALFFAFFLHKYRYTAILKTMQPLFLVTICAGNFIFALTILPLSLDDQALNPSGADAACMAIPWLLSMGMTVTFSALFSKLWRVNKLFNSTSFQRMKVTERDVMTPFVLLFTLNGVLLTVWNVIDPLRSQRLAVEGEEWKTYAACRSEDGVGYIFMYCAFAVNGVALLLACYQAYQARNISAEFAESRSVGLAVLCWLQVLLVGFPALYLVDPDDMTTSYFLQLGLIFVLSMSLMLIIFGPLIFLVFQYKRNPGEFLGRRGTRGSVYVSGASQANMGSFQSHRGGNVYRQQVLSPFMSGSRVSGSGRTSGSPEEGLHGNKTFMEIVAAVASGEMAVDGSYSSLGSGVGVRRKSKRLSVKLVKNFVDEELGNIEQAQEREDYEAVMSPYNEDTLRKPVENYMPLVDESKSLRGSAFTKRSSNPMALHDLSGEFESESFSASANADQNLVLLHGSSHSSKRRLMTDDQSDASSVPPFSGHMAMHESRQGRLMQDNIMHESDSSVPFAGGDFVDDNLLGEDSDSSVPFQGSDDPLQAPDELSALGGSSHRNLSNSNLAGELKSNIRSLSSSEKETVPKSTQKSNLAPPIIATIEHRTATRASEAPFSSRFLRYKNRMGLEASNNLVPNCEQEVHSTAESEDGSIPDLVAELNKMADRGHRSSSSLMAKMRDKGSRSSSSLMNRSHSSRTGLEGGSLHRSDRSGISLRQFEALDDFRIKPSRTAMSDRSYITQSRLKMSDRSDPVHYRGASSLQRRGEDDYGEEEHNAKQFPWDKEGKRASGMLGYGLPEEWQHVESPKQKKTGLKGTLTALHQSFAAFSFTPATGSKDADASVHSLDNLIPPPTNSNSTSGGTKKKKGAMFAGLNMSLPALHFDLFGKSDEEERFSMFDDSGSSGSLDLFENKAKSTKEASKQPGERCPKDQSFEDEPKNPGSGKSPSTLSPTNGKRTTDGDDKESLSDKFESLSDKFENEPKSSSSRSSESDPSAVAVRNVEASSKKDWDLRNQWENKKW